MSAPMADDSLLLVTHVPLREGRSGISLDDQTAAGVAQWCAHFDRVTFCGVADDPARAGSSSSVWVDAGDIGGGGRCALVAMPRAYRPDRMLREFRGASRVLWSAIPRHAHLCFSFGGLVGDWPAVAALGAIRQKRAYAAWLDRVEPDVLRNKTAGSSAAVRLGVAAFVPLVERYNGFLLGRSAVALLQGRDTFDHYRAVAPNPFCTYDTHLAAGDMIDADEMARKVERVRVGAPIRILYVGRADPMKGPFDWLDVLDRMRRNGVPFTARWIGDGPDLEAMRRRVAGSELSGAVELPGYEGDHGAILRAMRASDVFLFCHRTKESPRCLIEALSSGCALAGYDSAYARGLVEAAGGGRFGPKHDVDALAASIAALDRDRAELGRLVAEAARSGRQYTEESVYAHRARLMKQARSI